MTLTLNTHISSLTQLNVCRSVSEKSTVFTIEKPCRKIGQGQPRVII